MYHYFSTVSFFSVTARDGFDGQMALRAFSRLNLRWNMVHIKLRSDDSDGTFDPAIIFTLDESCEVFIKNSIKREIRQSIH